MSLRWEYEELFDSFMEDYNSYKKDNMSDREALARTSNEFETAFRQGEMEKAILNILYGELLLKQYKVLFNAKEVTKKELLSLDLNKLKLETTDEQYNSLLIRRKGVLDEIDKKKLDYSSRARWYYYDITDTVREYFNNQNFEVNHEEEVINNVLNRFKRDCNNTASENITVKTTLVELLLLHPININNYEHIKLLKNELEQFEMNSVGEQLSEDEKLDLSKRINEVLTKLQNL